MQTILEHKKIKKTEIYKHITAKGLQGIKSPLDDLKIEITDEY